MRFVRLFAGDDGQTHLEEVPIHFEKGDIGEVARLLKARGEVYLRRVVPSHSPNWHHAPQRQYVILLSGQMEIEASDGTVQRFGPGDVLLVEDVTGSGHLTRTIGNEPRILFNVPVEE